MWALFVVVFYLPTTAGSGKVVGSFEMRMESQEHCLKAKEKMERDWNYDRHRIATSCSFKGYL